MRNSVLAAICLLHSSLGLAGTEAEDIQHESAVTETGKLVVNVEGFENNNGTARLLLYNSAKSYPKKAIQQRMLPIRQRRARFELDELPLGVYAVIVYQEQSRDARPFDFHAVTPYRPVAFSNNARKEPGERGAPSFDNVKFTLDEAELEMTLVLFRPRLRPIRNNSALTFRANEEQCRHKRCDHALKG